MLKVRFTRDYLVKDGSGKKYKAGQVVELEDASAQHFINRAAARLVGDEAEAAEEEFQGGKGGVVEIPEDWQALDWPALRALASKVAGEDIRKKEDAVAAIEAELETRDAAD